MVTPSTIMKEIKAKGTDSYSISTLIDCITKVIKLTVKERK